MFYDKGIGYGVYLPDFLAEVEEFEALNQAVNAQEDGLNHRIESLVEDKYVATATESGILRWEKILGVSTPLNSTLQARREALKSKKMTKPPINLIVLKDIIETYMGIPVDISITGFEIKVFYRGVSKIADLTPLYVTIYNTIPANLLFSINYRYLTWEELDRLNMKFDQLDSKKITWDVFERGEWIG